MPRWIALFALAAPLAMGSGPSPRYYTFKGVIRAVQETDTGYAASIGIRPGDSVAYVFLADFKSKGYVLKQGARVYAPDSIEYLLGNGYSDAGPSSPSNPFFDSLLTPPLYAAALKDSQSIGYCGLWSVAYILGGCVPIDPRLPPPSTCGVPVGYLSTTDFRAAFGALGVKYTSDTAYYQGDTLIGRETGAWNAKQVLIDISAYTSPPIANSQIPPDSLKPGARLQGKERYFDGLDKSGLSSNVFTDLTLVGISSTPPGTPIRPRSRAALQPRIDLGPSGLEMTGPAGAALRTRIFDPSGRTWKDWTWAEKARLPGQDLPKGVFFVALYPEAGAPSIRAFAH